MPEHTTASGPSSLAANSILNSLIVTGSGNVITVSAADFLRDARARHHLRMLAVIASPAANRAGDGSPDGPPLDVWGEWERLRGAVEAADPVTRGAAVWAVVRLAQPTAAGLRDALAPADLGYQAVHFSCHGCPDGVWLEDDLGRERLLPTADLVAALRSDGRRPAPALVVLNACETLDVARALEKQAGVRAVIATCQPIYDLEAKLLAERLYRWLAAGRPIGEALDEYRCTLVERLAAGDLPDLGDPAVRAANVQLVGNPALTLRAEDPPAERPIFVLHPTPHNDPLPMSVLSGFVGRAVEQMRLARWFAADGRRAFALTGVGGIGKTALALTAALRHAHRFSALAFASAKSIPDFGPLQVLEALNASLGLTIAPGEVGNLPGAIASRLNNHPVLLVLDNLESLSPERTRELARGLDGLDARGGSRVLMTLRPRERDPLTALARPDDRLNLAQLDPVAALRLAWEQMETHGTKAWDAVPPMPVLSDAADRLTGLRRRAWLAWLDLPLVAALDRLAGLAFRHPAMLRLAVAMLAEHGWDDTVRRLERLQGQEVADALEEFIGHMLDDLAGRHPAAAEALYAVLPFAGGADAGRLRYTLLGRETAAAAEEAIEIADRLKPALSANLLRRDAGRYDLDAPVRAFLERRRPPAPAVQALFERRHAEAFLPLAEADEALWSASQVSLGALPEWDNVTAALERLRILSAADEDAARLLVSYTTAMLNILRNQYDARRDAWLSAAVAAAQRVSNPRDQANVLKAQGDVLAFQKQNVEALARYEAALGLFRAVGDRLGEANVLRAQGDVLAFQKQNVEALARYEAALGLFRAVGDRLGEANVLKAQGDVLAFQDRRDEALARYEAALGLFRAVGDRLGEANVLKAQGDVLAFQDRRDEALARYEAALGLFRAVGARLGEANVLRAQGDVLAFQKQNVEALARYEAALGLFRAVGDRLGEANVLQAQGDVLAFQDRRDEALARYEAALGLFRAVGARLGEANVLQAQGDVLAFQDRRDEALARYEAALGLFRAVGARLGEANVLQAQGDVLAFQDRRDEALARYEAALGLFRAVGDRLGEANVLRAQGDVLAFQKQNVEALARYEAALGLFRAVGARLGEANVLQAQGDVLAFQKQNGEALARYEAALGLFRAVGARLGEANVLQAQGQMALSSGAVEEGMSLLGAARTLYLAVGSRVGVLNCGILLARHAASREDFMAAIEYMQPAADFCFEIRHPMGPPLQAEIDNWKVQLAWREAQQNPEQLRALLQGAAAAARAANDSSQLTQVLAALRQVCQQLADWPGVAAAAEALIALGAADGETYAALGDSRSNQDDEAGAAVAYAQAVALAPDQAMLRRNYANSLIALGRLNEAGVQLDAAEALDPASPYLALRRAELAKARGDREDAIRWAQEALHRQPGWDEAEKVLREVEGNG